MEIPYNPALVLLLSLLYLGWYHLGVIINLIISFFVISVIIALYVIYKLKVSTPEHRDLILNTTMDIIKRFSDGNLQLFHIYPLIELLTH